MQDPSATPKSPEITCEVLESSMTVPFPDHNYSYSWDPDSKNFTHFDLDQHWPITADFAQAQRGLELGL